MNSCSRGDVTSAIEVTNVSSHGLRLLVRGEEPFLPYADFPWFREQPLDAVLNVEEASKDHFYWPDIDLSREIIEEPGRFPRTAKVGDE